MLIGHSSAVMIMGRGSRCLVVLGSLQVIRVSILHILHLVERRQEPGVAYQLSSGDVCLVRSSRDAFFMTLWLV